MPKRKKNEIQLDLLNANLEQAEKAEKRELAPRVPLRRKHNKPHKSLKDLWADAVKYARLGWSQFEIEAKTGISIQDVPEGLVVALALRSVGYSKGVSAGLGALSGLIEPLAAVFGAMVVGLSATLLPWGLAIAAGAMLFVISHQIIPESHRKGHESFATTGLMLGFVLMMLLDTALG